jgi:hypothetical protein
MFLAKAETAISTQACISLPFIAAVCCSYFYIFAHIYDRVASNSPLYTVKLTFKVSLRSTKLSNSFLGGRVIFNPTFSVGGKS